MKRKGVYCVIGCILCALVVITTVGCRQVWEEDNATEGGNVNPDTGGGDGTGTDGGGTDTGDGGGSDPDPEPDITISANNFDITASKAMVLDLAGVIEKSAASAQRISDNTDLTSSIQLKDQTELTAIQSGVTGPYDLHLQVANGTDKVEKKIVITVTTDTGYTIEDPSGVSASRVVAKDKTIALALSGTIPQGTTVVWDAQPATGSSATATITPDASDTTLATLEGTAVGEMIITATIGSETVQHRVTVYELVGTLPDILVGATTAIDVASFLQPAGVATLFPSGTIEDIGWIENTDAGEDGDITFEPSGDTTGDIKVTGQGEGRVTLEAQGPGNGVWLLSFKVIGIGGVKPEQPTLLANSVVIPVKETTTLRVVDTADQPLAGFTWSADSGSTAPQGAIITTDGVVTAGDIYGVFDVVATKDGVEVKAQVTIVDVLIEGAAWVEENKSLSVTAKVEPVVTGLATTYAWSVDSAYQNSIEPTGSTQAATLSLKAKQGESALTLDVPVKAEVTLGSAGTTATATLERIHKVDVVDLVFIAPSPVPEKLMIGEGATTFEVAIRPVGSDVPVGKVVSWEQNPTGSNAKLTITPESTDSSKAAIQAGTETYPNALVTATYGKGTEDITAQYLVEVANKAFVLIFEVPAAGLNLQLPLPNSSAELDFSVHWGDPTDSSATTDVKNSSDAIYAYPAAAASYMVEVSLTGNLTFGSAGGSWGARVPNQFSNYVKQLRGVKSFGDVRFINNLHTFSYVEANITLPADTEDIPYLEGDISYMFANTLAFDQDISHWDLTPVTNISAMFSKAIAFNNGGKPLSWGEGTRSITGTDAYEGMGFVFSGAKAFNQDISSWNVSNVMSMHDMFSATENFDQDISDWDISNVRNMTNMFKGAKAFNNGGEPLDWVVNPAKPWQVKNMTSMFDRTEAFNQDISGWDVRNVETMWLMFREAQKFNQNISAWEFDKIHTMRSMFEGALEFDQDMRTWVNWAYRSTVNYGTKGNSNWWYDSTKLPPGF